MNRPRISGNVIVMAAAAVAQKLLEANIHRKSLLICNNSADDETHTMYLLSDNDQVVADGIPIKAGKSYSNDHYNCQGEYWIISTNSVTLDVRIEEDLDQ